MGVTRTMRIARSHRWDLSVEEAIRLQQRWAKGVILKGGIRRPHWVAGADVAFDRNGTTAIGVAVMMDMSLGKTVEVVWAKGRVRFPYIPGLLTFREGPVLLECLRKLRARPDVILFDGQGIAHPRRFGLACHLGYLLELPTVGCAKSLLYGRHAPVGNPVGSEALLFNEEKNPLGGVIRSQRGSPPIYVSPGHRLGVEGALEVVRACLKGHRLPEPLFQADRLSKEGLPR